MPARVVKSMEEPPFFAKSSMVASSMVTTATGCTRDTSVTPFTVTTSPFVASTEVVEPSVLVTDEAWGTVVSEP